MTPFSVAVLITLGLVGLNGLMISLMQLQPGFLGMAHFAEPRHRIHDLTFGFLFVPAVVGMVAQLRRPSQNVAGQLMALIPWVGLVLTLLVTLVLTNNTNLLNLAWIGPAAFTLTSATLHPTGRDLFRSFSVSRVNGVMLALVIIAAVPLLGSVSSNIGLQGSVANDHAAMGHYGFMAAFGFTVIGVGLLASLRPEGWRLTAWVAGVMPVLLGLASLAFPVDSSLDIVWALAAVIWGVAFVAAAELTRRAQSPAITRSTTPAREDMHVGDMGTDPDGKAAEPPDRGSTTSTPRFAWVIMILAILLVLLFFSMHFSGGGIPVH